LEWTGYRYLLILFVAIRDIRQGEEVTFDYAMTDWDYFEFLCNCRECDCRNVVRGFKFLPAGKREEYKGFLSLHLERLLKEFGSQLNLQ